MSESSSSDSDSTSSSSTDQADFGSNDQTQALFPDQLQQEQELRQRNNVRKEENINDGMDLLQNPLKKADIYNKAKEEEETHSYEREYLEKNLRTVMKLSLVNIICLVITIVMLNLVIATCNIRGVQSNINRVRKLNIMCKEQIDILAQFPVKDLK